MVGIGAFIPVALVLHYHMTFDGYHANSDHIARVSTQITLPASESVYAASSKVLAPMLKEQVSGVKQVVRTRYMPATVQVADGNSGETAGEGMGNAYPLFADKGFFELFTAHAVAGDLAYALDDPAGLVINQSTAIRLFGDNDPLGRQVTLETPGGSFSLTVRAVVMDLPENVSFGYTMLASFSLIESTMRDNLGGLVPGLSTYLLLEEPVAQSDIAARLEGFKGEHFPEGLREVMTLLPVAYDQLHFTIGHQFDGGRKGSRLNNLALAALAIFLLVVSIANYVNLSTAVMMRRSKELAIRRIMGENAPGQYVQLLTESVSLLMLVLTLVAGLTYFFIPELEAMLNLQLRTGWLEGISFYMALLAFGVLLGVVSSIIPFWLLSRTKNMLALKGAGSGTSRSRMRYALLSIQLVVAVLFGIIAMGMQEQLAYIKQADLGFQREGIMTMGITDPQVNTRADAIKEALLQQSHVKAVSISLTPIIGDHVRANFQLPADTSGASHLMNVNYVDHDFDKVYQVQLLSGRFFNPDFASDIGRAFILNEEAVEVMGIGSVDMATGMKLAKMEGDSLLSGIIIGVVKNYHFQSLYREMEPMIWQIVPDAPRNLLAVRTEGKDGAEAEATIAEVLKEVGISQEMELTPLSEALANVYREDNQLSFFIRVSSGITIFIAMLGVFGLAVFILEARKKEIGIRKLLGAGMSHIVAQLGRPFAVALGLALVVAAPTSYYFLGTWLEAFAYHVAISWWYVPVVAVPIGLLMGATVFRQVSKAASTNPAEVLREE